MLITNIAFKSTGFNQWTLIAEVNGMPVSTHFCDASTKEAFDHAGNPEHERAKMRIEHTLSMLYEKRVIERDSYLTFPDGSLLHLN